MCGRYTSRTSAGDLASYFGVDEVVAPDLGARYNVAPTDEVYAVAETREGVRRLGTFRWGLVPFWAESPKAGAKMINARVETLLAKPAFRRPLERRRCIIPADGFYEWERVAGSAQKQPWYITRHDGKPMAFAGLWETWRPKDAAEGPALRSCVIITGPPDAAVARLHDRMPVQLAPETWDVWLDPGNDDAASLHAVLTSAGTGAGAGTYDLVPVSRAVNTVTNDGPELIEVVEAPAPGGGAPST